MCWLKFWLLKGFSEIYPIFLFKTWAMPKKWNSESRTLGPPLLFFDQTEKNFWETPPPLNEGLDLPLLACSGLSVSRDLREVKGTQNHACVI